ncbi:nucleoprotein [Orthophasmavirus kigluaikense]|uniref:Nucleoprotein n=1 Tax=Orthophasmavirus kigluaikense TaxID=3052549 RepID=A0A059XT43_9VIRU|nr:nucleoprotein [Orthophasmavirus kigluaikense]AIA24561.1 nucleoprotein [Orthophasmavirus kigluaikense]
MDKPSEAFTTAENSMVGLNLEGPVQEAVRKTFDMHAKTIATMASHPCSRDYNMFLNTCESVSKEYNSAGLDAEKLCREMSYVNPDFMLEPGWEVGHQALNFMAKVIFEVGPETRSVKVGSGTDKSYRFRFVRQYDAADIGRVASKMGAKNPPNAPSTSAARPNAVDVVTAYKAKIREHSVENGEAGTVVSGMVIVKTYKNTIAPQSEPTVKNGVLVLTIKQASFLALYKFKEFVKVCVARDTTILTPLCGAIFSRDDIDLMLADPEIKAVITDKTELLVALNLSAQNGGQFVEGSRTDIAGVCAIMGTVNVEKKLRMQIISKTAKQFLAKDRPMDKGLFHAVGKYAAGGLPAEWQAEILVQELEAAKITYRQILAAKKATERAIRMEVPNFDGSEN